MMEQSHRLDGGGRIDRSRKLDFTFNHQTYKGYEGDTLASALLANGLRVVGRGFKFHRPRGVLSAGAEEANALVRLGQEGYAEPTVRATLQPLYDGLSASSQNCWPSVGCDLGACLDLLSGLWPAGFYNKTFMWPNWHWYEGVIRRAAGLGVLPDRDEPDYYVQQNVHCDVLICGAGPAGLAAALAASKSGARVMLVDHEPGGSLLWRPGYIDGQTSDAWLSASVRALNKDKRITLLCNATAVGFFDHNVLLISERLNDRHGSSGRPRERLWKVRAKQVVLATGAIEQPLLFPNNDRPGIMLASAVSQFLNRYAVTVGKRVVIATNNDSAYQTALDLHDAGVKVQAVIDSRVETGSTFFNQLRERGIPLFQNCLPLDTNGRKGVNTVQVAQLDSHIDGHTGSHEATSFRRVAELQCDAIAMSGGWQPAIHLFSQARGSLRYDPEQAAFLPKQIPENIHIVGAANGTQILNEALSEGHQTGIAAAVAAGFTLTSVSDAPRTDESEDSSQSFNTQRVTIAYKPERQWIDFQHDVTLRDIHIAAQENYRSVEHLKRYTTTGMSIDQGKTSNINALTALAYCTNKRVDEVGTTTFRPFYMPVTLGAIAGRRRGDLYATIQRSPIDVCHVSLGAAYQDYGSWRRPAAYPQDDESLTQAIQREVRAVRQSVGIFDGSPLGKIEVRGPDAAELLNRFYINNVHSLQAGRARYGLMLNDNGIVIDDGIFVRLSADHFLVHTTSGNATQIYAWMEEWLQRKWSHLNVLLTPVTNQWANVVISGPRSREVLQRIDVDIDLQADSFPHMHYREGKVDGVVPVRLLRASFTGELSYEINVPADYGCALWRNLLQAGEDFTITPYGIESLMVLRTEKGYLHIGADTDGATTPLDLGWENVIENKSADFLGKRSLTRSHNRRTDRLRFVGIEPQDEQSRIMVGAHILNAEDHNTPASSQGYVTSACYSPNLKRWIALGLVKGGQARGKKNINLFHDDKVQAARLVKPTFYDPQGEHLHA